MSAAYAFVANDLSRFRSKPTFLRNPFPWPGYKLRDPVGGYVMDEMNCLHIYLNGPVRVDEYATLKVMADLLEMDVADLDRFESDPVLFAAVPPRLIRRHRIVPLCRTRDAVRVATADPFDFTAFEALRAVFGTPVEPVLAAPGAIRRAIKRYMGSAPR